jgi:trk system potassium uptake protein TrkA
LFLPPSFVCQKQPAALLRRGAFVRTESAAMPTTTPREYLVIGLGRFGSSLATKLEELGCQVLATDIDPKLTQELSSKLSQVVTADSTSLESLTALGAEAFPTAIVCIGLDFEANVLITSALKHNFGVPTVIAKALTFRQRDVLLRVGADRVVLPEHDSGVKLAYQLDSSLAAAQRLEIEPGLSVSVLRCPKALQAKKVSELDLESKYGVSLMSVKAERRLLHLDPDEIVAAESILVLLGPDGGIARLVYDHPDDPARDA